MILSRNPSLFGNDLFTIGLFHLENAHSNSAIGSSGSYSYGGQQFYFDTSFKKFGAYSLRLSGTKAYYNIIPSGTNHLYFFDFIIDFWFFFSYSNVFTNHFGFYINNNSTAVLYLTTIGTEMRLYYAASMTIIGSFPLSELTTGSFNHIVIGRNKSGANDNFILGDNGYYRQFGGQAAVNFSSTSYGFENKNSYTFRIDEVRISTRTLRSLNLHYNMSGRKMYNFPDRAY